MTRRKQPPAPAVETERFAVQVPRVLAARMHADVVAMMRANPAMTWAECRTRVALEGLAKAWPEAAG